MGVELRDMGITPAYAPIIKRAAHRMNDGRSVIVTVDTNLATEAGDDTTGVAKIYVYLSTNSDRTAFTQAIAYTPASACATATRAFVGSSALRENNQLAVVYTAADNSLRLIVWTWGGSSWGAPSEETIIAANAVTRRFRAVDVDFAPSNGNIAVAVYESLASTGQGMWIRLYVKNTGGTWTKAWEHNQFTTQFIKDGAEDVCIMWNNEGIVSNVGEIAIYYTWTSTTVDNGDYVRLISYNVSTGTTNSGTLVNSWFTTLNKGIATGSRRGWLYREDDDRWMLATCLGTTTPQFISMRLRAGTWTGVVQNKSSVAIHSQIYSRKLVIVKSFGTAMSAVSTDYADGRVLFAIAGKGAGLNIAYMARLLVMRFDATNLNNGSALSMDTESRALDGGYNVNNGEPVGVVGIYGGGGKYNFDGTDSYNFAVIYGGDGLPTKVRSVTEDTYTAPVYAGPTGTSAINAPQVRASFQNGSIFSNLRGKMEWQFSTSADYSTDLRIFIQDDSKYQSFSSTNGVQLPMRSVLDVLVAGDPDEELFPDTWYGRVRVVDDLGGVSPWSATTTFTVSHPPTAQNVTPRNNGTTSWTTGDTKFAWQFADTEPLDEQTAYQVVVVRNDTGAVVHDTGKVSSSVQTATIDLPDTLTGIPLQWSVSLWDTDDTQGPFSNPFIWTMFHAPRVAVTDPPLFFTLTTALPTVEWTFDANGDRTQRAYRVVIEDITDLEARFVAGDSGWIIGDENGYTFPTNVLVNARQYEVYVEVQDSVGLYGSSEGNLVTNYDFENNVLGWTATNATVERSIVYKVSGKYSMKLTPGGGGLEASVISDKFPCMHDQQHRGSVWVYMPVGFAGDVSVELHMYDVDGDFLASVGSIDVITPGQWTELEAFNTTDASDFYMAIAVELDNTSTATDVIYIDYATVRLTPVTGDTDWTEPAQPSTTVTFDNFKATISWTDGALDPDFISYRVYRKYSVVSDEDLDINNTGETWVLIHETDENSPTVQFLDYLVPLNTPVEYAVVQLVDRFGSLIESDINFSTQITATGDRYYFVPKNGIGSIASYEAGSINGDSFTRNVEQEAIHVVGQGMQVQIGDDLGYAGTLTIRLRNWETSRRDRQFFEYLSANNDGEVYLKSPFGDVILVSIGAVSTSRIAGVGGSSDMADITVPYQQVFGLAEVTRPA